MHNSMTILMLFFFLSNNSMTILMLWGQYYTNLPGIQNLPPPFFSSSPYFNPTVRQLISIPKKQKPLTRFFKQLSPLPMYLSYSYIFRRPNHFQTTNSVQHLLFVLSPQKVPHYHMSIFLGACIAFFYN